MKRNVVLFVLLALLAGCSSMPDIMQGEKIKYRGAGKLPPLEVPPDLSQLPRDDRFLVPERPQTITASGQQQPGRSGTTDAVPTAATSASSSAPHSTPRNTKPARATAVAGSSRYAESAWPT